MNRTRSRQRLRLQTLGLLVVLAFSSSVASAEIYKWKDRAGRLHFSQDLGQVPPEYRAQAKGKSFEEGKSNVIQRYDAKAPPAAKANRSRSQALLRPASSASSKVYRIRVQRAGSSMRVNVRLNDRVTAPFILDTGASDISLPLWVAKELGLDLESARTAHYRTANGVIEKPLVTLESVDLGGARVTNVPASVSKTMSVGLLGLSFFNHFKYHFDPGTGIVTLSPNGLAESGALLGGRSRQQWSSQFGHLAYRQAMIEKSIDGASSNASRRKSELKDALGELERQLDLLEDEADDARVPMQWRN